MDCSRRRHRHPGYEHGHVSGPHGDGVDCFWTLQAGGLSDWPPSAGNRVLDFPSSPPGGLAPDGVYTTRRDPSVDSTTRGHQGKSNEQGNAIRLTFLMISLIVTNFF